MRAVRRSAASRRLVEVPLAGPVRVIAERPRGFEALRVLPPGDAAVVMAATRAGRACATGWISAAERRTRLAVAGDGRGSFSPDGTRVFAETGPVEAGQAVLRTVAGRRLRTFRPGVADLPIDAAWSRDSRRLFVVDQLDAERRTFRVRVIDARTGALRATRRVNGAPVLARESSSPSGGRIAIALRRPDDAGAARADPGAGERAPRRVSHTCTYRPHGRRTGAGSPWPRRREIDCSRPAAARRTPDRDAGDDARRAHLVT